MPPTTESNSLTETAAPRSRAQRAADAVLVVAFLIAVTVPAAGMLFSNSAAEVERTENRRAAPFPELVYRRVGPILWPKSFCVEKFPHSFECWFRDRVGFRQPLIRSYNLAKVFGLTVDNRLALGEAAHGRVTVGRDGWLFLAGKEIDADFRRTDPFTDAELAGWRSYLTERRAWLAAANIGYAFFAAPNQQTIYPEYMPRSMTRADRPSRFDQLLAEAEREPSFSVVDLREILLAGKSTYPTYHQTDTHWNDYGAWLAYRRVLAEIGKSFELSPPAPLEAFDVRCERVVNHGDMVLALNAPIDFQGTLVTLEPREPRAAQWDVVDVVPNVQSLKSTNYAVSKGRLVVFRDSFLDAMRPYLSEHFREVYYFSDFSAEAIVELRPDFVLEELAERHLMADVRTNPPRMQTPLSAGPPAMIAREQDATKPQRR